MAYLSDRIKHYFNIMPDKDDEQEIIRQVSSGVSFKGANLWVLIFAIFIASLGLNVNSTAVIIGAMLISPLMGPIIGMGLAVGINDLDLLHRAAKNFAVATVISVLTATVYFLITPLGEAQSELLARTSPTIYDVLIATCGGAAGIIALCTRGKGNVIPGVAIATALMPPLCTAGYGLATGHLLYFLGAFYLFFINTVFIALATYIGVRLMNFSQHESLTAERARKSKRIITAITLVTVIPAVVLTIGIVRQSIMGNNINHFVRDELSQAGTEIISSDVDIETRTLQIIAVGKEIPPTVQQQAAARMKGYGLGDYTLSVIQGAQSDSLLTLNSRLSSITTREQDGQHRIAELTAANNELRNALEPYNTLNDISADVSNEARDLFAGINGLALSLMPAADSTARHCVVALVDVRPGQRLNDSDSQRLAAWLKTRVKADSLIVATPR